MSSSSIEANKIHFLLQDRRSVVPQNEYDQVKKVNLTQLINMIDAVGGLTSSGGGSIPDTLSITEVLSSNCGTTGILFEPTTDNGWLAFCPTGNGFISMNVPDGTTANGDCRGTLAVDWQKSRTSADQVASGDYSFLGAGQNNLVAGNNSGILSGSNNYIGATASYSGIVAGQNNTITEGSVATFSFIGSGQNNVVMGGLGSVLVGGIENTMTTLGTNASSNYNMIGSGKQNLIEANLMTANIIVGGLRNTISSPAGANVNDAYYNFIGGGRDNRMVTTNSTDSGLYGTIILGGHSNIIIVDGISQQDAILSGSLNAIVASGSERNNSYYNVIVGGNLNSIVDNWGSKASIISGGYQNRIYYNSGGGGSQANSIIGGALSTMSGSTNASIISGKNHNLINSFFSTIVGGDSNSMSTSSMSGMLSGRNNDMFTCDYSNIITGNRNIMNISDFSSILGGSSNTMNNSNRSIIFGGRENSMLTSNNSLIGGGFHYLNNNEYSSIISGINNTINRVSTGTGRSNTIIGGLSNIMQVNNNMKANAMIGGELNTILLPSDANSVSFYWNFMAGGYLNKMETLSSTDTSIHGSVIIGGRCNIMSFEGRSLHDLIIGGRQNAIDLVSPYSSFKDSVGNIILGGIANTIESFYDLSANTILSGNNNRIFNQFSSGAYILSYNAIIGGDQNTILKDFSADLKNSLIIGGNNNLLKGNENNILIGGASNQITNSNNSSILGGSNNLLTGTNSLILGGSSNVISSSVTNSVAGGNNNTVSHSNVFCWNADPVNPLMSSTDQEACWQVPNGFKIIGPADVAGTLTASDVTTSSFTTNTLNASDINTGSITTTCVNSNDISTTNLTSNGTINANFIQSSCAVITNITANSADINSFFGGSTFFGCVTFTNCVTFSCVVQAVNIQSSNFNGGNANIFGTIQATNLEVTCIDTTNINANQLQVTCINADNVQINNVQTNNVNAINIKSINACLSDISSAQSCLAFIRSNQITVSCLFVNNRLVVNGVANIVCLCFSDRLQTICGAITGNSRICIDGGTQIELNANSNICLNASQITIIGNVCIRGTLDKDVGSFKIDHPIEPYNKYLYHSFVESPDMLNIYCNKVVLDENGDAYVQLPEWFQEVNGKFTYQLTPLGKSCSNLYISEEISKNKFKISGGFKGLEVSWMVTGIRQDLVALDKRVNAEVDKEEEKIGNLRYDPFNSKCNLDHLNVEEKKLRKKYIDRLNKKKNNLK